jgi:prepilin-type N-terminal cleavage/methylation domain-containing protein
MRQAFTLAEMLVVLAILAITTTVAVQSLAPVASQARTQGTQVSLNTIGAAIVSTNANSSPGAGNLVTGYLADVGAYPRMVVDSTTNMTTVNDLLVQPTDLSVPLFGDTTSGIATLPYPQLGNPTGTISIPWGWRGPYAQPPHAQTTSMSSVLNINDGWGNPISLHTIPATNSPLIIGTQTFPSLPYGALAVVSGGDATTTHPVDSLASTTDVTLTIPATATGAQIGGSLYISTGSALTGVWSVNLCRPGPGGTNGVLTYKATITPNDGNTLTQSKSVACDQVTYQLAAAPIGPAVVYVTNSGTATGQAVYLNVLPGNLSPVNLRVQ